MWWEAGRISDEMALEKINITVFLLCVPQCLGEYIEIRNFQ